MSNQMQVFTNSEFGQIRVIEIDGLPWFVGRDVAEILRYAKPQNAVSMHVDGDDALKWGIIDAMGRSQETTLINESGLYSLILSSKLPAAKAFKRWITSEVLPTIRKHGAYITDDTLRRMREDGAFSDELLQRLADERGINEALLDYVDKIGPKARYCDLIINCGGLIPVSVIAKDYGLSAVAFNMLLYELGVQYKAGGTWLLRQGYAGMGYTVTRTCTIDGKTAWVHTWWTPKGRAWLYDILHRRGYMTEAEKFAADSEGAGD